MSAIFIAIISSILINHNVIGARKMNSYSGRSSLARTIYQRMITDEQHRHDNHSYWYYIDRQKLPADFCEKFVQFHQDREATEFLENCYEKADWVFVQLGHSLAKSVLGWFMTSTSINGLLGRGSMFIFSKSQLAELLDLPGNWRGESLLDLGAGDGRVTEKMSPYFRNVFTTEASKPMINRLTDKGYIVLDVDKWDNGSLTYDLIGCLNLLDRCDKPISILHSIKKVLRPGTGRVIVAVVLPFKPYVEFGSSDHKPTENILLNGRTFEEQVTSIVKDVFEPAGFSLVKFTRLPYLCEGDMESSFYMLDDFVFVLKVTDPG